MNIIRQLRREVGLTQQGLAARAGTSQPTVALYEAGLKSPTLETLQRLAASLDLDMMVTFVPRMSREDRRSLAFHRFVVDKLRKNSAPLIERATSNLRCLQPRARELTERWKEWLKLPLAELTVRMLDGSELSREMRQVSPFSGVLSASERKKILGEFRKTER